MQLKLISDFKDYYDHVFYPNGDVIFRRVAHDRAMPKYRQFEIMNRAGLAVPPFHAVGSSQAEKIYGPDDSIVLYTDEYQHCGGGKALTSYGQAACDVSHQLAPAYCVPWYNTTGDFNSSQSHRYLQIGSIAFWLRYDGSGGWMSNHADTTEIRLMGWCDLIGGHTLASYPMCAIDFVVPVDRPTPVNFADVLDHGVAIDFNTAPGLRWTGLDEVLSAVDFYALLLEWFKNA